MKILGIDPGLKVCGYACLQTNETEREILEAGVIKTDERLHLEARLNQISCDISHLLDNHNPDVVAVEELYSHYAHPRTAILMAHARGVILQKCAERTIEIKSFSPTRIKKAVTGNGRASKQQVQRTIRSIFKLTEIPEPNDIADAIAAALCCGNSNYALQKYLVH
ncbi:MAG: crossover junction endodeoxyribonuclease RuvC [Sedimentisphaerales bacterium]|nr:crossover junction endodeoxyribonuclease RuvC [Sedimentisphaerales bacterium]